MRHIVASYELLVSQGTQREALLYGTVKTQFTGKCQWYNYETIIGLKSVKCHRLALRCQQSDKMHSNLTREIHLLTTMLNPTAINKVSDIESWGKLCKYEINRFDGQYEWVSEWVYRPHQHIIGHFGDESFQSIACTGTDNLTRTTKQQNTQITLK